VYVCVEHHTSIRVDRILIINSEIMFSLLALWTDASQKGRMSTAGLRTRVLKRGKLMQLASHVVFNIKWSLKFSDVHLN